MEAISLLSHSVMPITRQIIHKVTVLSERSRGPSSKIGYGFYSIYIPFVEKQIKVLGQKADCWRSREAGDGEGGCLEQRER